MKQQHARGTKESNIKLLAKQSFFPSFWLSLSYLVPKRYFDPSRDPLCLWHTWIESKMPRRNVQVSLLRSRETKLPVFFSISRSED